MVVSPSDTSPPRPFTPHLLKVVLADPRGPAGGVQPAVVLAHLQPPALQVAPRLQVLREHPRGVEVVPLPRHQDHRLLPRGQRPHPRGRAGQRRGQRRRGPAEGEGRAGHGGAGAEGRGRADGPGHLDQGPQPRRRRVRGDGPLRPRGRRGRGPGAVHPNERPRAPERVRGQDGGRDGAAAVAGRATPGLDRAGAWGGGLQGPEGGGGGGQGRAAQARREGGEEGLQFRGRDVVGGGVVLEPRDDVEHVMQERRRLFGGGGRRGGGGGGLGWVYGQHHITLHRCGITAPVMGTEHAMSLRLPPRWTRGLGLPVTLPSTSTAKPPDTHQGLGTPVPVTYTHTRACTHAHARAHTHDCKTNGHNAVSECQNPRQLERQTGKSMFAANRRLSAVTGKAGMGSHRGG